MIAQRWFKRQDSHTDLFMANSVFLKLEYLLVGNSSPDYLAKITTIWANGHNLGR